jgi:hypothetical protein
VAVRWVLAIAVFLYFVADAEAFYAHHWVAPFAWAHTILFEPLPYKIRPFDHITALCLFLALRSSDGRGPRVPAMRNALLLAVITIVVCFLYGLVRGGSAWAASWQVYLMLSGVLFSFSVAAAFRTPEHYVLLGKAIMAAAAYRAMMCWLFFLFYVQTQRIDPPPEMLTTHDDTVLWVVSMLVLLVRIFGSSRVVDQLKYGLFFLFLAGAVLWNQRRLAWVSLAMGVVVVLALIPPGRLLRRIKRVALVVAPILVLYVAIGWGRTERVFTPLRAFATVTVEEDASVKARNAENLGLIATSNTGGMWMGTGWGHPYIELSNKYSIADLFPQWQYVPHNSILGLLAYTGVLGFCGYWLAFPSAMFLNARMARMAAAPLARELGLIGAAQLVVCANQFYGDMGIYFLKPIYMLSLSYALALRLPILTGVWPDTRRNVTKRPEPGSA